MPSASVGRTNRFPCRNRARTCTICLTLSRLLRAYVCSHYLGYSQVSESNKSNKNDTHQKKKKTKKRKLHNTRDKIVGLFYEMYASQAVLTTSTQCYIIVLLFASCTCGSKQTGSCWSTPGAQRCRVPFKGTSIISVTFLCVYGLDLDFGHSRNT